MAKFLIENFLVIFIGIIIITQIILPSFTSLKYFWLFKKTQKNITPPLADEVDQKVSEFKQVVKKVDDNLDEAQNLKDKTKI